MGCGGSKEQGETAQPIVPMQRNPQSRAGTRQGTRPATRTQSRRGPPETQRRTSTAGGTASRSGAHPSRHGSRAGSRRPSAGPSSAHGRHGHERRREQLSTLEEQPPEDDTIQHEISTLNTFIDQHAQSYYPSQSDGRGISIRRLIGETIINDIIKKRMNGKVSARVPQLLMRQRLKCKQ